MKFDVTVLTSVVFAVADCTVSHFAVNHGLVTVLPHMTPLTRAGVTTSAVTPKALTLDYEKVCTPGPGNDSLSGLGAGSCEVTTVGWTVGLVVVPDASKKLCVELLGNVW